MKILWPTLFTIATASLSLGLLEAVLDMRGAEQYVRPYHYSAALITVFLAVLLFWPAYRCVGWIRRRGAFFSSILFLFTLLSIWALTLPLGDRIAIHYERLDPMRFMVRGDPGYGWFYWDDSGMGNWPMSIGYLLWSLSRPWIPILFLAFFPCFFILHRKSNSTGKPDIRQDQS